MKLSIAVAQAKKQGKTIDHFIAGLNTVFAHREVRFPILEEDFKAYGAKVLEAFESRVKEAGYELPKSYEGVLCSFSERTAPAGRRFAPPCMIR